MEMPEGWLRLRKETDSWRGQMAMDQDIVLSLIKEMAETLGELEKYAPKDLPENQPWIPVLKKFKEWK